MPAPARTDRVLPYSWSVIALLRDQQYFGLE